MVICGRCLGSGWDNGGVCPHCDGATDRFRIEEDNRFWLASYRIFGDDRDMQRALAADAQLKRMEGD